MPQKTSSPISKDANIYIFHDRAHTEIIFKSTTLSKNFLKEFHRYISFIEQGYLAFSYGDRSFMLHTPKWKDLQIKIALPALFFNTDALIRVGHYQAIREDDSVIKVSLSKNSFQTLQYAIVKSFRHKNDTFIPISKADKASYLYYFKAKRPYNLFYTCNTWTGDMLRQADIPISYWTPLAYQVVYGFL